MQNTVHIYERKYNNIFDILSEIGGVVQFIFYIFYWINFSYNRYTIAFDTNNLFFTVRAENNGINSLKFDNLKRKSKEFKDKKEIPLCECGGVIKPDVVLYGEALPEDVVEGSIEKISKCDTLIVGGTSLNVYPAAGLINYFRGKNLVVINKEKLNIVNALEINENIGEVFSKIKIK